MSKLFAIKLLVCILAVLPINSGYSKSFRVSRAFGKIPSHSISKARSSRFITGLVAGSLLFSKSGNAVNYEDSYSLSYDDELFIEYERNNQLLEKGNLSSEKRVKLERRNQQIKNKLIKSAEKQYISSYSLKLIPIKQKVIETKVGQLESTLLPDFFDVFSAKEKSLDPMERKEILYQLTLFTESPKPIDDFDVLSINGVEPNQNNPYLFNYSEKWGNNTIKVTLRDKKDHSLIIELTKSYYVNDVEKIEYNSIGPWVSKLLGFELLLFIPFVLFNLLKPNVGD